MSPFSPFELTLRVRMTDVDSHRRATVAAVGGWLQEAAATHARTLGFSNKRLGMDHLAWVLTRLCVRMTDYPESGQQVRVQTWPSTLEKLRALRDFRLFSQDGTEIGAATSSWVIMDTNTRKAVLPGDYFSHVYPDEAVRAAQTTGKTLPRLRESQCEAAIVPRRSDLDENNHVNNVRLLEWALEATPEDRLNTRPTVVDIAYRSECRQGDVVTARCAVQPDKTLLHALTNDADGREIVRLRTLWPE